jgi:hypothetical protein
MSYTKTHQALNALSYEREGKEGLADQGKHLRLESGDEPLSAPGLADLV